MTENVFLVFLSFYSLSWCEWQAVCLLKGSGGLTGWRTPNPGPAPKHILLDQHMVTARPPLSGQVGVSKLVGMDGVYFLKVECMTCNDL